jgi:LPXTG-motif cell wall-anchored protein
MSLMNTDRALVVLGIINFVGVAILILGAAYFLIKKRNNAVCSI